jgi:hypothetical protein
MTFPSANQPGDTYLLWHRFRMPTEHGSKDAVAVPTKVADKLLAAYTFMLEHIVLLIWGITVVLLLLICIKIYERAHDSTAFHSEIYNKRSSPFNTLKAAVRYSIRTKSPSRRWLIFARAALWITLALAFVVVKYTVPIIFAPYIKISSAAPVNPAAIFVPWVDTNSNDSDSLLKAYTISVPWAIRAAGSIGQVNNGANKARPVSVDDYEVLRVRSDGQKVIRLGYKYKVTGLDFGLQFYPDLTLDVEGSCTTEYGWINESGTFSNSPATFAENYVPFNDPINWRGQVVSLLDGGPPMAYFFAQEPEYTNTSWAAIISSTNRTSPSPGTDPWYLTEESDEAGKFRVKAGRPALSCWQNDVWSYLGHTSSVEALNSTALPGLNLSPGLQSIFATNLGVPMIYKIGSYLRATSLKSALIALSADFNATSSSMHDDLERLVWASYIATVNVLTETTLFVNDNGTPNKLKVDGHLNDGADQFVISTSKATALSVRSLIIIPTLTVGLWVIFLVLMFFPGKVVRSRFKREKEEHNETPQTADGKIEEKPPADAPGNENNGRAEKRDDALIEDMDETVGTVVEQVAQIFHLDQDGADNT